MSLLLLLRYRDSGGAPPPVVAPYAPIGTAAPILVRAPDVTDDELAVLLAFLLT